MRVLTYCHLIGKFQKGGKSCDQSFKKKHYKKVPSTIYPRPSTKTYTLCISNRNQRCLSRFHTPVLDNTIKLPYLRTENLKNHTLFRGTFLYSPYMGVPPPPRVQTTPLNSTARQRRGRRDWNISLGTTYLPSQEGKRFFAFKRIRMSTCYFN